MSETSGEVSEIIPKINCIYCQIQLIIYLFLIKINEFYPPKSWMSFYQVLLIFPFGYFFIENYAIMMLLCR